MSDRPDRSKEESTIDRLLDYAFEQAAHVDRTGPAGALLEISKDAFRGYQILNRIHRGGQGVVYKAIQESTGKTVAIKVLRAGAFAGPGSKIRFQREVAILAQLNHPLIVAVQDSGSAHGADFFVMEYIEGEHLDVFVARTEPTDRELLELFATICDAVNAAHLRGVIHRDLKPSNIRVGTDGRPHILDFGLAKDDSEDAESWQVTETGQFVGSLHWASPEQARGEGSEVDVRTDVYALGVVFFHLLTGDFPYDVIGNMRDVLDNILEAVPVRPSTISRRINDEIETIILKCLQKDPQRRYQNAGELGQDVRRYLGGEPIEAKRDSTWYVLSKTAKRHRWAFGGILAVILLGLGYVVNSTALTQRATAAERVAEAERSEAQRKYVLARETLEFVVNEVSTGLAGIGRARNARRKILQGAYARLQGMLAENSGDSALTEEVARAHLQLGDIAHAIGDALSAEEHFRTTVAIVDELLVASPENRELLRLDTLGHIRWGDVFRERGALTQAEAEYELSHTLIERTSRRAGQSPTAISDLTWSFARRGTVQLALGKTVQARELYERQLESAERYVHAYSDSEDAQFALFMSYRNLATVPTDAPDGRTAAEWDTASLPIGQRLLEQNPDNLLYVRRVAAAYLTCARIEFARDNEDLGNLYLESAEALHERASFEDPEAAEARNAFASCRLERGHQASRRGDWLAATEDYVAVTVWLQDVVEGDEVVTDAYRALFRATYGAALGYLNTGEMERSRELSLEAVGLANTMLAAAAADQGTVKFYADFLRLVGRRALPDISNAIETLDALVAQLGEVLPMTQLAIARAYCSVERFDIGAVEYSKALPEVAENLDEARLAVLQHELLSCISAKNKRLSDPPE